MIKLRLVLFFFVIFFIAIGVKLVYIQILHKRVSASDYLTIKRIMPERGKILDHNGEPMVVNQPSYLLYAEPQHIEDIHEAAQKLDQILHLGESTIEARLDKTKVWTSIISNIDDATRQKIIALKIDGLGFEERRKRFYPESSLSAHIVGFVGKNSESEDVGYFGIEGFYDKDLSGLPGVMRSERDLVGRPIFVGTQERLEPEDGRDLYLTIDKTVQHIIKKRLMAGLESYKAKEGCVIVADPDTMQIVGLSCLPDFDPEKYYQFTEENFKNPAISNLYEPGSTFKPLVVAAAIEEKAMRPDELFDEDGPVEVGGYTIRTWNNKYEGTISVTRILEKSSNVGMVMIGDKLGDKKLYDYIKKFGFGATTDIDLEGEVPGTLKDEHSWYPIDYATATFGQGIAVTPIQMIRAFASIINGGKVMQPYVVSKLGEREREPHVVTQIVSKRTSDILKKMLVSTVENGEVKWAKPKGYTIGGKTGTAQIPIQGHYDPSKTIASFIGFAPADKPKFIALVIVREPEASIWGSETAAPLFMDVAKELLAYYNIPPDEK